MDQHYIIHKFQLPNDYEGKVEATLLEKNVTNSKKAVLYIHGFIDYYFQHHVADWFNEKGYSFYALDLRKCGRSLMKHQTPNFCKNLIEYDNEINLAIEKAKEKHSHLTLLGHSNGGLISTFYTHRFPEKIDALILNAPFFEFNANWFSRNITIPMIRIVAKLFPKFKLPLRLSSNNAISLHENEKGEWNYNTDFKPLKGFNIYAGWMGTVFHHQKIIQNGIDLKIPVLVLASDKHTYSTSWIEEAHFSDSVLNTDRIIKFSKKLGQNTQIETIKNSKHDVFLSCIKERENAFKVLQDWLKVNT